MLYPALCFRKIFQRKPASGSIVFHVLHPAHGDYDIVTERLPENLIVILPERQGKAQEGRLFFPVLRYARIQNDKPLSGSALLYLCGTCGGCC
jgi:hypothetical protein